MLELDRVKFKEAIASKELCKGTVKLQGWMVSLTPVGEKDVMSPSTTLELKGQPKLAVIHTHTACVQCAANMHNTHEQCCMNIMDHRQLATCTQTKVSQ